MVQCVLACCKAPVFAEVDSGAPKLFARTSELKFGSAPADVDVPKGIRDKKHDESHTKASKEGASR